MGIAVEDNGMSMAALIRNMAAAGASPEAIALAIEAIEAEQNKAAEKRAQAAARKARQRDRERDSHATVTAMSSDADVTKAPPYSPLPLSPTPPNPNPPISPQNKKQGQGAGGEFEAWYARYPHKVGRGQAERAFSKAIREASMETLVAGLEAYIRDKPPDRDWCNPATWLNGKRWLDQPNELQTPKGNRNGQRTVQDQFKRAFERVDAYIEAMD